MRGFWSRGVSGTLNLLPGPDQRPQGDEGPFLLGCGAEAAIDPLACHQRGHCSPNSCVSFGCAQREQRLQSVKQISLLPASVVRLVGRHQSCQLWQDLAVLAGGKCESVNAGHNRIGRKVSIPVVPLILQLHQAQKMLLDLRTVLHPRPKRCPQGQAADRKARCRLCPKHLSIGKHHRRKALLRRSRGKKPEMKCSHA